MIKFFHAEQKILSGARNALSYSFARENCIKCNRTCFGEPICKSCKDILLNHKIDFEKRCSICGKELLSEKNKCTKCRVENCFSNTSKVLPVFPYRIWIKKMIFEWKMGNRRSLSPIFAQVLKRALDSLCLVPDNCVIVPVPPRPGKIRKKGWDQVDELCDFLKKLYGFQVLKVLERMSKVQQKQMDREERLSMKGKTYRTSKKGEKIMSVYIEENRLTPKTFVLVDDVITTGATVDSCAEILKKMGATDVKVLSLVIVD